MRMNEIIKRMRADGKAPDRPRLNGHKYEGKPVKVTEKEPPRGNKKPKWVIFWKPNKIFNDELCKMEVR